MSGDELRVALLHGVDAGTADVTPDVQDGWVQVEAVREALGRLGLRGEPVLLTRDEAPARARLARGRWLGVFNLVESVGGDARRVHRGAAVCQALGLPCSGSTAGSLLRTSHKLFTKRRLARNGLPTPPWIAAEPPRRHAGADPGENDAGPWLIKPLWEDASVGIDGAGLLSVRGAAGVRRVRARLADLRRERGGAWFAERYVAGREFNVSLLAGTPPVTTRGPSPQALPVAEIRFEGFPPERPHILDYRAKWEPDSFEYRHTPRVFPDPAAEGPLLAALAALALRCWPLFGLGGYARVDFRVDEAGRPWMLEVNANPSLSPDAGCVAAAARAGLDFDAVIARVAAAAWPGFPSPTVSAGPARPGAHPRSAQRAP